MRTRTAHRAELAIDAWDLRQCQPLGRGGVGYVYRARLADGHAVVLKVEPATSAWADQRSDRALALWARPGLAPQLLAVRDRGRTLLLDRVTPGSTLGEHTPLVDESFPVIADLARRLREVPRSDADGSFPTIADHARTHGWRDILSRHRPGAVAELDDLLTMEATTLIHNDLYQDNVLRAGNGSSPLRWCTSSIPLVRR